MGAAKKESILALMNKYLPQDFSFKKELFDEMAVLFEEESSKDKIHFESTFSKMLEGVQIINQDYCYLFVNDAVVKQSQYSREELIGSTMLALYPGIENTELFGTLSRCMKERTSAQFVNRFDYPDGTTGWFELSIQPVSEGLLILSLDISERKKTEEKINKLNEELEQNVKDRTAQLEKSLKQLKESEERFQKAFQASAAGIAITEVSTAKYFEVNDAFSKIIGFEMDEIVGRTSLDLGIIVNEPRREEKIRQMRTYGKTEFFENTIKTKNGQLKEVLSSAETILLDGVLFAISVVFDITDRKRAEDQLVRINHELEAFSYSISHDLRAPLRAINGYAKLLFEDYEAKLDDEGKRIIEVICSNALKMGVLIDELLEFSRLGRKELKKTAVDMNLLVASVLNEANKNVKLDVKIEIDDLAHVNGDKSLLYQVMFNLINNAFKYSSKKQLPEIKISSSTKDGELVFSVSDNGAGFDMDYADKLFGVFQRLHSQDAFEGVGVGLAIVKRIIMKHGGKVWAHGEVDNGATFYFSLPLE